MKKSQRARLASLLAQATRNAPEETELASLQTLAAAHPDASKDTAESPTVSVEGLMAKFTAAFSARETLARENTVLQQRVTALEAGNVGAVTLGAVLPALGLKVTDFVGKDCAAIADAIKASANTVVAAQSTQIATLTTERDRATGALAAVGTALGLKLDALDDSPENLAKLGIKADEDFKKLSAAEQSAAVTQAAFAHLISSRTLAQVSELGFNAAALPAAQPSTTESGSESTELLARYESLVQAGKVGEAGKFWNANFARMFPAGHN
jgi:hypothetical protein